VQIAIAIHPVSNHGLVCVTIRPALDVKREVNLDESCIKFCLNFLTHLLIPCQQITFHGMPALR